MSIEEVEQPLKLGKTPATRDLRDFLFAHYEVKGVEIPRAKVGFGHKNLIENWGMLGNDYYGDCVPAAADHGTMLWNAIAGKEAGFTTENTLSDYSAMTGFDENDPNSDNGTNMRDALNYRRNTGVIDNAGTRHKIGAYVALDPKDWNQMLQALEVFDLVEIGFEVPEYAMEQFNAGKMWAYTHGPHANIVGGHDVIIVGRPHVSTVEVVTWGKIQDMTRAFYQHYNDEAYGIVSEESLVNGKTAEGFDLAALYAAVKQI